MLIGLYRHKDPLTTIRQERLLAMANEALRQNVKLVVFHSKSVNFSTEEIQGKQFDGTAWQDVKTPFPTVMINEIPTLSSKRTESEKRLRDKITCTTFLIGDKREIYRKLAKDDTLSTLLIPTEEIRAAADILPFVQRAAHGAVLKPVNGRQGKAIYFVQKRHALYAVREHTVEKLFTADELQAFFAPLLEDTLYLAQPYVQCRTQQQEPYDFRVHVQRNAQGEWTLTKLYPRIGNAQSILSNISRGGYSTDIQPFLTAQFGARATIIYDQLQQIAFDVATYIDGQYLFTLDELGIDLAIDADERFWLYEVNGGPQTKHHEAERAVHTIGYATYLTRLHEAKQPVDDRPLVGAMRKGTVVTTIMVAHHHVSQANGMRFYYFLPEDIQADGETIYGYEVHYPNKKFRQFRKPDIVYDLVKGRDLAKYQQVYDTIAQWGVPVSYKLDNGSVSKKAVYVGMLADDMTKQYVIPYEPVQSVAQVLRFLQTHQTVAVKAEKGAGGKSVHKLVQLDGERYEMTFQKEVCILEKPELIAYVTNKWHTAHIIQKFVTSMTLQQRPFDVRAHLVRGRDKTLQIAEVYARIGSNEGAVSNISLGGYLRKWRDFSVEQFGNNAERVGERLQRAIGDVTSHLERRYGEAIPEVGLDFAITPEGEIWLFEYNLFAPDSILHEYEVANLIFAYFSTLYKESRS